VVMQEDVTRTDAAVVFPREIKVGANVRCSAEDFSRGQLLYAPGRRLNAYDLALLATAGIAGVPVYARPRALVVATGDELVAPGEVLRPGQIYESNRLATLAQLHDFGVEAEDGGVVADDPARLRALLERSADFDFIITSGGASVGDHDVVKQVFAEIGDIAFWNVSVKPGKPIAFGHIGRRTHFFALPGNPVSSLVTYKLFVEPALWRWHHAPAQPWPLHAVAANGFRRQPGRTEFLRARLYGANDRLMVEVLKGQGSHMIGAIRDTNGFIRVESDSTGFDAGDSVRVVPMAEMR
jgi:molybdopterin molybdotransferase